MTDETLVQSPDSSYCLPKDFLSGPGPEKIIRKLDFTQIGLPEYKGLYAVVIDNAFTKEECNNLVHAAEAQSGGTWEQALVNVGGGQQALMTDTRNCGRIIWDDRDVVEKLWLRIQDSVPEIQYLSNRPEVTGLWLVRKNVTLKMTRLNERMRFLRYEEEQYFRQAHMDGSYYTPDRQETSYFTLHLYLNESDPNSSDGPLEGGATTFHSLNQTHSYDVDPKIGRVLIFQHRGLLHSGADVSNGIKLTLRTDLMYRKVDPEL